MSVKWSALRCGVDLKACAETAGIPHSKSIADRQLATANEILDRFVEQPGVILADEVGMGKTYVAIAVASAVLAAGGRVQVCVPKAVMPKWQRDFQRCAKHAMPDIAQPMSAPILLARYQDVFFERVGLNCAGTNSCRDYQNCNRTQDKSRLGPLANGDPPSLLIWRAESTEFQVRQNTYCNDNVRVSVIAAMASRRGGNTNHKRWWGTQFNDDTNTKDTRWKYLTERISRWALDYKPREYASGYWPEKVIERIKSAVTGQAGDRARRWSESESAKAELLDALNGLCDGEPKPMQRLWLGYAGVPDLLILDEAHKGKSDSGKLSRALKLFNNQPVKVLGLTATPFDLEPHELGRLLTRVCISKPPIGEEVSERAVQDMEAYAAARDTFVEEWEKASVGQARIGKELPPALESARNKIHAAKENYKKALGKWMLRGHKMVTDPYCLFPLDKRVSNTIHWHRKYDQENSLVAALAKDDFHTLLLFERLEVEARSLRRDLVARHGSKKVSEMEENANGTLGGHARYIRTALDFGYFDLKEHILLCHAMQANLPKVDADAIERLGILATLAERLTRRLKRGNGAEHPKQRHARELICKICEPVASTREGASRPAGELRKVLIFSNHNRPLKYLGEVLQQHAALRIYPPLLALEDERGVRATAYAKKQLPGWLAPAKRTGPETRERYGLRFDDAKLKRAAGIREYISEKWWEPVRNLMVRDTDMRSFLGAMTSGTDAAEGRIAKALLFSPLQIARWSASLGPRESATPESLWDFSREDLRDALAFVDEGLCNIATSDANDEEDGEKPPQTGDREERAWQAQNLANLTSRQLTWSHVVFRDTGESTRWALQLLFNTRFAPYVLLAQSAILREGVDLHRYCRDVIHYDLEWAAGAMEQREGRVDRVNSLWERDFAKWLKCDQQKRAEDPPQINVYALRVKDSYDDKRWNTIRRRQSELMAGMGASLFGDLENCEPRTLSDFEDETVIASLLPDFGLQSNKVVAREKSQVQKYPDVEQKNAQTL